MPRPKVHPSNRLRASEACTRCKASKKRCSFTFPCSNCIRAGRGDICTASSRDRGSKFNTLSRRTGLRTRANLRVSLPSTLRHEHAETSTSNEAASGSLPPTETRHRTHPRMLRSLQGEKVYVGGSASLSFLQLLRDTVTKSLGPSQFSHNARIENMLESRAQLDNLPYSENLLSLDQKIALVGVYDVATCGFIHVISKSEALLLLGEPVTIESSKNKAKMAVKDLILAIGAQCCVAEPLTAQAESFYFVRGQRYAFVGMLENPSLDLIRAFILMSFYLLGACRRNATFMYLGVASRAAVALGLHNRESHKFVTVAEQQKRSRVWMSLCVLDRMVNSILGRPPTMSIPCEDAGSDFLGNMQQISKEDGYLIASYRVSAIITEIVSTLYDNKAVSTDAAEILLDKLKLWSNEFSHTLQSLPNVDHTFSEAQEFTLGSLNVSCLYYFAVTLVTRPFLVSTLTAQVASLRQDQQDMPSIPSVNQHRKHSKLASACVDSAKYMIQTALEVHQANLLLNNMCMLKAFVFAAALILGFSMFSQREMDFELESAFTGARHILEMLSPQSAQAAHYFEILTLLSNAITKQRQSLALRSVCVKAKSPYVSRIFSLNASKTPPEAQIETIISNNQLPSRASENSSILDSWIPDNQSAYSVLPEEIEGAFMAWDYPELSAWDSFPFLSDVFTVDEQGAA